MPTLRVNKGLTVEALWIFAAVRTTGCFKIYGERDPLPQRRGLFRVFQLHPLLMPCTLREVVL